MAITEMVERITPIAQKASFVDHNGKSTRPAELWPPLVIPKEDIEAEIEQLCRRPRPSDGRRRSLIVHPYSAEPGLGLAPGIQVALEVLLPGEHTSPARHNSEEVVFCIDGTGTVRVDRQARNFERYDVWNVPSMATCVHINDTSERQVRLVYSNACLLEKLGVYYVDDNPGESLPGIPAEEVASTEASSWQEDAIALGEDGASLMPYERLVNPPTAPSPALLWPWKQVKAELSELRGLGPSYKGRRLYVLYNPATGRTLGTTHSFFAAITMRPAGISDRPHRHASAAVNYYFAGRGHSVVGGHRYEWKAGDLMLSAPGWAVHAHASGGEDVYELTIQDHPFHLANDSLLWQENLKRPPILLGSHMGWSTNRLEL